MKSIKNILTEYRFLILISALLISILLIIYFTVPIEQIKFNSSILIQVDSTKATSNSILNHNERLISSLQVRESLDANSMFSQIDGIRQTRSIYVAIIGIILTLIFSNSKIERVFVYLSLLVIIFIFYGLDIHLEDLLERSKQTKDLTSNALNTLINEVPQDSIWYELNYKSRNIEFEKLSTTSFCRKLINMFHPSDAVHVILYIIPLPIFYLFFAYSTKKYLQNRNQKG